MKFPGKKIEVKKLSVDQLQVEHGKAKRELDRVRAVDRSAMSRAELERYHADATKVAERVGEMGGELRQRGAHPDQILEQAQRNEMLSMSGTQRLARWEQQQAEHEEKYLKFKRDVAEGERRARERTREELRRVGRVTHPVKWEGVDPRPLAVLCSAMVWRWSRNLFDPGTTYFDPLTGRTSNDPMPGTDRAPCVDPLIDGDHILALWLALMICSERGEAPDYRVSFNPHEPLLWPREWPRNVAHFGRLRALGLIEFKYSADQWEFALGPDSRRLLEQFEEAFAPPPPEPKRKRREKRREPSVDEELASAEAAVRARLASEPTQTAPSSLPESGRGDRERAAEAKQEEHA